MREPRKSLLHEYRPTILTLFIGLLLLELYALFLKGPFLYPGLERRVAWVMLPTAVLGILSLLPLIKIGSYLRNTFDKLTRQVQPRIFALLNIIGQRAFATFIITAFLCLLTITILIDRGAIIFTTTQKLFLLTSTTILGLLFLQYKHEGLINLDKDTFKDNIDRKKRESQFLKKYQKTSKRNLFHRIGKFFAGEGKYYSALLIILIFIGLLLRMWNVTNIYLNVDEAISGLAAKGVLETGKPIMPSGFHYNRDFLTSYFLAGGIALLGNTELGLRIVTILAGCITIGITYYLAREFLPRNTAMLAAALVAVASIEIAFSRWARMYAILQCLTMLTTFFTVHAVKKKTLLMAILAMGASILAFFTHRSAALLVVGVACILLICHRTRLIALAKEPGTLWMAGIALILAGIFTDSLAQAYEKYVFGFTGKYSLGFFFGKIGASYRLITGEIGVVLIALAILGFCILLIHQTPSVSFLELSLLLFLVVVSPLAVDVLIYSQGLDHRIRYIYFIIPIIFIFAATAITALTRTLPKWIASFLVIILLFVTPATILIPQESYPLEGVMESSNENVNPLLTVINENPEAVIVAAPTETVAFYSRSPEYWLMTHPEEIRLYAIDRKYRYTGSTVVDSKEDLTRILESEKTIVIFERTRWRFIQNDVKEYIRQDMHYQPTLSNSGTDVFTNFPVKT